MKLQVLSSLLLLFFAARQLAALATSNAGSVTTNAPVATELPMFIDWPETSFWEVGRNKMMAKVKSLSPYRRFVIALHSPHGVVETGLLMCLPEKIALKLACGVQRDNFSGPI